MKQFERRREVRRIFYSRGTALVLSLVVLLLARSTWAVYKNQQAAIEKRESAIREQMELESRRSELAAEVENLRTPGGAEAEARKKFPVALPGEQVMIVLEGTGEATATAATSTGKGGFLNSVTRFFAR